ARTHAALSFVYGKLLRHKVGGDVPPGAFIVEPDLAERWEAPDDTTYIFYLRQGVKWHNKPPVNGRELVADDVKFTFDRFLTIEGNPGRELLESVAGVEVVDRYTVKFLLKEPFVWLLDTLASGLCMWIIAPEVVKQYGDLKKVETAIGTGPFVLEQYEPNVKTVFRRNPDYFRPGLPYVMGWSGWSWRTNRPDWRCIAPGSSMPVRACSGTCASPTWLRSSRAIRTCTIRTCWPTTRRRSGCAPIRLPSPMCACGAPSPTPSIARGSLRPCGCEAKCHRRCLAVWPSGRCPSTSSGRVPSTISTILR